MFLVNLCFFLFFMSDPTLKILFPSGNLKLMDQSIVHCWILLQSQFIDFILSCCIPLGYFPKSVLFQRRNAFLFIYFLLSFLKCLLFLIFNNHFAVLLWTFWHAHISFWNVFLLFSFFLILLFSSEKVPFETVSF